MNATAYILIAILSVLFLVSCASTKSLDVKQLPQTIHQARVFYETDRPKVVKAVDGFRANWDKVPDQYKPTLVELYGELQKLDAIGADLVKLDDALLALQSGDASVIKNVLTSLKNVDVDKILAAVLKIATTYAQLKSTGVV